MEKHPVVYLDCSQIESGPPEQLENELKEKLQEIASSHKISIAGSSIKAQLRKLIARLANSNSVVVLVDDYDQPMINHLKNPKITEKNRDILKSFFETLKSLDSYLKFTFITGISKFSQVSFFPALTT